MSLRLKPEELILLEENLNRTFSQLFPGASGTVYCLQAPPRGTVSRESGYQVCFLPEEHAIQIPLILGNNRLGGFLLKNIRIKESAGYGPILAQLADLCLKNFVLSQEKQTDPLTGLLNRPTFITRIEQSIDLAARFLQPGQPSFELNSSESRPDFSLLAVSVTNFEQIHKEHGYQFSDSVLFSVARKLQELCPEQAQLARLGEEVFGVLIPGTGAVQSKKIAVKLRQGFQQLCLHRPGTRDKLALKLGVGYTNYPQDLHGSQLRPPGYEKARTLLNNVFSALARAKESDADHPFAFARILTHGGQVIEKVSLDRVKLNLGYLHQAVEGLRFLVHGRTGSEQGRPFPLEGKSPPKGEVLLVEVGPDESLAEILYVQEPKKAILPGDALTLSRTRTRDLTQRSGQEEDSGILSFQGFLWNWQRDREQRKVFSLLLIRHQSPRDRDLSEEQAADPIAFILDKVKKLHGIIGEYGSSSLIAYLPELTPEASQKTAETISELLQHQGSLAPVVAIACYPCLDSSRAQILDNCRKTLVHAQMLAPPRIACFDSQTLTISGDRYYLNNDLPGACQEYSLALILDPQNTTARNSLGICLARLGQINRAATEFQEVLSLEPQNCLARYNLGYVSLKTGNHQESIASFQKCLEQDPDHVFSLLRLGQLAEEDQNIEKARQYYTQVKTTPEGKKHAYRFLGKLDLKEGNPEQARGNLHQALIHNPQDPEAMHLLARLYLEDGEDLDIAESLARKSAALRPEQIDFLELVNTILVKQGKGDQARFLWGGRSRSIDFRCL